MRVEVVPHDFCLIVLRDFPSCRGLQGFAVSTKCNSHALRDLKGNNKWCFLKSCVQVEVQLMKVELLHQKLKFTNIEVIVLGCCFKQKDNKVVTNVSSW